MRFRTFGVIACLAASLPAGSASALEILVYDNGNPNHSLAKAAAMGIDLAGTTVAITGNFNTLLGSQAWDVVVVDCAGTIPTGGLNPLIAYVNGGGRCVMSFWDWDNSSGGALGLTQAFGATGTTSKIMLVDGVTSFAATAAGVAQGVFLGVSMPNTSWHNHWADDGDVFTLPPASVSLGTAAGGTVMFRGNQGRTIASFVLDEAGATWLGNGSGVNLWRNMIRNVLNAPCAKSIEFDGTPGTAAPPATLGFYQMSAFPANSPCPPASVSSVTLLPGATVSFSTPLVHYSVAGGPASACQSWGSWSHGYTGDVYFTAGDTVTVIMPTSPQIGAFYMYIEPNALSDFVITATANDGTTSGPITVSGTSGARYFGFWASSGEINFITVTQPGGLAQGFAIGEFGIAPASQTVFSAGPGTGAPPATLGPYPITAFPLDTPCPPATVTSVPSPLGGSVDFSATLQHRSVNGGAVSACSGWGSWSHGYNGDVYFTGDTFAAGTLTLTMPQGTAAFRMYVEPNSTAGTFNFVVHTDNGTTSGTVAVAGTSGARFFGFYGNGNSTILSIDVTQTTGTSQGFAVGEFGIARSPCYNVCFGGIPQLLDCPSDLNGSGSVDAIDLGIMLSSWSLPNPTSSRGCGGAIPCCADLNHDGLVNTLDLGILLGDWVSLPGGDPHCP